MRTTISSHKKNILILGAGYCGLGVARKLAKKLVNNHEYQIVLVDKNIRHVYSADLYEIATAYYSRVTNACLRELSESVSVPYNSILRDKAIIFVNDTIINIDYSNKKIELKNHDPCEFEYLVLALGSVTNFYNLPGVAENSFPLKTLSDALALECHFDQLFKARYEQKNHKALNIVIGGGGFTGVEYACELPGFIRKLSRKYHLDRREEKIKNTMIFSPFLKIKKNDVAKPFPHEIKITLAQGGSELIGLGKTVSGIAAKRLKALGVDVIYNARITNYQNKKLEIANNNGSKYSILADILIWTAGIQPSPLLKQFPILGFGGGVEVLPNLEATHYPKVYAGGDNASIFDPKHHSYLPKLGQLAVQQSFVIAYNIWADIEGHRQVIYKPSFKGFILALGGKYFVYHKNNFTIAGFIPWIMRRVIDLWYFLTLLPLKKALLKWWHTENIFLQND